MTLNEDLERIEAIEGATPEERLGLTMFANTVAFLREESECCDSCAGHVHDVFDQMARSIEERT